MCGAIPWYYLKDYRAKNIKCLKCETISNPTTSATVCAALDATVCTVKVKSINCPQSNPQIRLAWLSLEPNSPIQKLNCEVDTGTGCNGLPYNILKATFGNVILKPATVHIIAFDDNAVKVMGSCIIHAHSGKTVYKLECRFTKTEGYCILGRDTAVKINYVNFAEVKPPQRSLHNLISTQVVSQESATVSLDN